VRRVEGGFQRSLGFALAARVEDARAIKESGTRCKPKVYPGFLSSRRQGLRVHIGTRDRHLLHDPALELL
jgi:hypothetical protein